MQACGFRDTHQNFRRPGRSSWAFRRIPLESHDAFRDKFHLPFHLLADKDHKVADRYGAWGEKLNYGKKIMGMYRNTYLIDPEGKIAHVFSRAD